MINESNAQNRAPATAPSRGQERAKSSGVDKIRVLIADDHVTVTAGLASIIGLQPDMRVIAEAANGRDAVDLWRKHRPDVALLDLRMPVLDGVGAIEQIHQEDASARVIVLTTYDTDNEIYRAIKAGAKGYVLKDARRDELLDCIRRVSRGETCIPLSLVEKLAAGVSSETLTGRELDVLTLLARGKLANFDVAASGGQNGVRWMEIAAVAQKVKVGSLRVRQQGTYAPDGNWRWMGSVARDKVGNILVGYSESCGTTCSGGTPMFPSIFVAGRLPSDPLGTLEPEVLVVGGAGSQPDTSNRWGDYSSMRIDQDGCTFWYTTEYYKVTQSFDWSTQIASAKFANCQ